MSSISAPSSSSSIESPTTHRITTTTSTTTTNTSNNASSSSSSNNHNKYSTKSSSSSSMDVTRRMICGGISGMIAKTVTNPLDRIKMLSQTGEYITTTTTTTTTSLTKSSHTNTNTNGLWYTIQHITNIYRSIIKNEGIIGLWAGNGINLLRVFPNKAIIFSTNDMYYKYISQWYFTHNSNTTTTTTTTTTHNNMTSQQGLQQLVLPPIYSFIAGGFAGMTATAITYPLDLARGRIAGKVGRIMIPQPPPPPAVVVATTTTITTITNHQNHPKVYNGMIQTILVTIKDEGIFGLYKGITPTLLGAMPYVGIQFGTVGLLEKYFDRNQNNAFLQSSNNDDTNNNHNNNKKKQQHDPLQKMIFGGIGGIMAGIITYPNDTIRRILQLQGSRGTTIVYNGYIHCFTSIISQYGISRLYRGWTINMIRMAPNTAVIFGSYEFLKHITTQYGI